MNTDEVLAQYRQMYGQMMQMAQQQASPAPAPVQEQPQAEPEQQAEEVQAQLGGWSQTMDNLNTRKQRSKGADRRAAFDEEFENFGPVKKYGEKMMQVADQLRAAMNDPRSPIDEEQAKEILMKMIDEEVRPRSEGRKKKGGKK